MKVMKSLVMLALIALPALAFGEEHGGVMASGGAEKAYASFAAFLGLGIAALGSALGLGKAVSAVLEGISRNPGAAEKMGTPMFVGFAFIEALTIYALVIALLKG